MLQLFKNNHFLNSLLLLPLTILIHLSVFIYEPDPSFSGAAYLGRLILESINITSVWTQITYILIVFLQATLINRLVVMHRLSNQITLIPGLLWIAFSAFHPDLMGLSAPTLALFFVLIGFNSLFKSYQKKNSATNIYNTGFFFGLSSLFYFPLTLLVIFGLTGLYTVRNIRQREVNQYLVGWVTPYFLMLCYSYVYDSLKSFFELQWEVNWALFEMNLINYNNDLVFWIMFGLIFIICMLNYNMYFSKKVIYAQKKISIFFSYFIFVLIALFFTQDAGMIYALLFLWPLSYFLTESLVSLKNQLLAELFTWLVILFSFFMQYQAIL